MNFSFVFVTSTWPRWRERFPATGPTEPGSSDRGWGGKASGPLWVDQEKPRLADGLGLTDGWMNETHCMSQHPVSCPTIWFLRMYPRHVLRGLNGTECSSFSDMETINCIKRRVERLGYCTMLPFFSSLLPAFAARHRPGYSTGCCWRPRHFILFGEKKTLKYSGLSSQFLSISMHDKRTDRCPFWLRRWRAATFLRLQARPIIRSWVELSSYLCGPLTSNNSI